MSADFSKVTQHLSMSLREHADAEYDGKPMGAVRKAVFLDRGGHAPGAMCALDSQRLSSDPKEEQ